MLVEFTVQNFLSFKDSVTFSMVASSIKEHMDRNIFLEKNIKLLKSAVIYGANASGKSNLFKAMQFMKDFVIDSSKSMQVGEKINVKKFRLSSETLNEPSTFEITFVQNETMYRYGFKVQESNVVNEWLYWRKNIKETQLFFRDKNKITIKNKFKEGLNLDDKTRENALFLSVVAQFNGKISSEIVKWFSNFTVISGLQDRYISHTFDFLDEKFEENKNIILHLLNLADLGIDDFNFESNQENLFAKYIADSHEYENLKKFLVRKFDPDIITLHKKYDSDNNFIGHELFNMNEDESEGTRKIFALSGKLLDALLYNKVLVIDELDSRLHPLLTRSIIKLFHNNSEILNGQLIFNTHDTNLLTNKIFRRDQIWFTEKNNFGATDLYSLIEYNVRNDASYGKDYLMGKYGAIPFINSTEFYKGVQKDGN